MQEIAFSGESHIARPAPRKKPIYLFFSISLIVFFATSSMYIFPSGMPQPADFLLFGASVLFILVTMRLAPEFRQAALYCFLFAIYVMVLSFAWVALLSHPPMLTMPAYFWYNASAFLAILFAATRNLEGTLKLLKFAVMIGVLSLLAQFMLEFNPERQRQTAGFNNPNQLGYFALCLVGLLLLLRRASIMSYVTFVIFFTLASIPLLLSFSSTAVAGLVFALAVFVLSEFRKSAFTFFLAAVLVTLAVVGVLVELQQGESYLANNLAARISRLDGKINAAGDARGFTRVLQYPQYLIFGAGEGARFRFSENHQHQLHSTILTLVFSYGMIGFALFAVMNLAILYRAPIFFWGVMALPHIYGTTHQGLRQTLFWILMATILVVVVKERSQNTREQQHGR